MQDAALQFISRRLEQLLIDRGVIPEAARAVLKERGHDPALAAATGTALQVHWNVPICCPSCLLIA